MTQPTVLIAERYRLIESLGVGGMGRVWLARDEMLRRDVAIKEVIPPEGLTPQERDELRLRTLREARAAARLNDANVVRIYDVVHTEQAPWIVMEYVPSRSLHQVITDDGPLPPERVAQIGLAVLGALRAAHGAGVMHRDVKPGNVLLAVTGRVVLTDFGLAVFEGGDGAVTRPGLILGSPQYISPERAREGTSGPESDMWSLGATLYAAVEGRSPYARSTTYATLTALATEEPDVPIRAGVLKPVLTALLRKDPRSRAGMAETERLLQRAAAGEGRGWSWSRPPLPLPRQRRSREGHSWGSVDLAAPISAAPISATPAETSDRSPEPIPIVPGPLELNSFDDDTGRTVPRRRRLRSGLVLAGTVVVALVAGAALYFFRSEPSVPEAAAPSVAPSSAASSPIVEGEIGRDRLSLPPGYQWVENKDFGWRVGLPIGWQPVKSDTSPTMIYYVSNTDPRMRVGIDTSSAPDLGDMKVAQTGNESAHKKALANYVKIHINPVQGYLGECADWQYTYDSSQGHMRVSDLSCRVRANLGETLYWECPADMWDSPPVQTIYGMIKGSFQPRA